MMLIRWPFTISPSHHISKMLMLQTNQKIASLLLCVFIFFGRWMRKASNKHKTNISKKCFITVKQDKSKRTIKIFRTLLSFLQDMPWRKDFLLLNYYHCLLSLFNKIKKIVNSLLCHLHAHIKSEFMEWRLGNIILWLLNVDKKVREIFCFWITILSLSLSTHTHILS